MVGLDVVPIGCGNRSSSPAETRFRWRSRLPSDQPTPRWERPGRADLHVGPNIPVTRSRRSASSMMELLCIRPARSKATCARRGRARCRNGTTSGPAHRNLRRHCLPETKVRVQGRSFEAGSRAACLHRTAGRPHGLGVVGGSVSAANQTAAEAGPPVDRKSENPDLDGYRGDRRRPRGADRAFSERASVAIPGPEVERRKSLKAGQLSPGDVCMFCTRSLRSRGACRMGGSGTATTVSQGRAGKVPNRP